MEHFKEIIEKGRVNFLTVSSGGVIGLSTTFVMLGGCLFALYRLNFSSNPKLENQPVAFLNVVFVVLTILFIYLLLLSKQKLKITFYKNDDSLDKKNSTIKIISAENKWKLRRIDMNYYFFWEDNWIFQSYYITIVIDENGYYINSYPFLDRIFDFGVSQKHSDEIYEDLNRCL